MLLREDREEAVADAATRLIYWLVSLSTLPRVTSPLPGEHALHGLEHSGRAWGLAFGPFAARYAPILLRARRPGGG